MPAKRNYRKRRNYRKKKSTQKPSTKLSNTLMKVVETRKLCPGPRFVKYDHAGTDLNGLSATQSNNFILNPCNFEWSNLASGASPVDGRQIFCKYLSQKLLFSFPEDEQAILKPMRVQVIWGFIKRPLSYTEYTTPKVDEVKKSEIINDVFKQVEQEWDSPDDQLTFKDRRPSVYKIVGRRWLKPDRRFRIGMPQTADPSHESYTGAPPDVKMTLNWPMNHKWVLEKSTPYGETAFRYNNENYMPFTNIVSYDYGNETGTGNRTEAQLIQCQHNSCLWYQDC